MGLINGSESRLLHLPQGTFVLERLNHQCVMGNFIKLRRCGYILSYQDLRFTSMLTQYVRSMEISALLLEHHLIHQASRKTASTLTSMHRQSAIQMPPLVAGQSSSSSREEVSTRCPIRTWMESHSSSLLAITSL